MIPQSWFISRPGRTLLTTARFRASPAAAMAARKLGGVQGEGVKRRVEPRRKYGPVYLGPTKAHPYFSCRSTAHTVRRSFDF